ncbi:hypothetical protein Psi02_42460 [Planotetraspora silvatica]|uniref:Tyr recombinase domain-containing protein n=1 Tax=Planotetraspora silvatica TaxID=234614 RepID=A0A8J3UMM1_9ACTN|nr:hypothetical protein [Planotetraspora silvatica]GII47822.1 hypothetical protein Psi02_42460 [Planotetraspora silvatica]
MSRPGKVVSPRDVCSDTGLARLSYGQARALLDEHTAVCGPGTGWDLHEYRHSALTHLGEQGASLLMLMAKSRHRKPENVPPLLQAVPGSDLGADEPARAWRRAPLNPAVTGVTWVKPWLGAEHRLRAAGA